MTSQTVKHVLVVAGLGNGSGTGASTARLFAKNGYSVALIARRTAAVEKLAEEINNNGGQAKPFAIASYSDDDVKSAWSAIHKEFPKPEYVIRAAVFNAAHGAFKGFLDVTHEDVENSLQVNVAAAFSFSRQAILTFKDNDIEEPKGKRGTLLFTGATASLRGNTFTSAFAAGKFGLRALSQSLAKEFGKENIHVTHAIIDGVILTDRAREYKNDPEWEKKIDGRLNPDSIAASYLYLTNQDRSSWTWELDRRSFFINTDALEALKSDLAVRPAHEKW